MLHTRCFCSPNSAGEHALNCPLAQNPRIIPVGTVITFPSGLPPAPPTPTGWVCPKCSASNGPHVNQCACSTPKPGGLRLLMETSGS